MEQDFKNEPSSLSAGRQDKSRFSRSPHPYHRQSLDLPDPVFKAERRPLITRSNIVERLSPSSANFSVAQEVVTSPVDYFDFGARNFDDHTAPSSDNKLTSSHSDSGTEADDERPLLRALTAPPLRPRKGLRTAKSQEGDSYISPLPTPSLIERPQVTPAHPGDLRKGSTHTRADTRSKATGVSGTIHKAGIARRLLETALLAGSTFLNFGNADRALQQFLLRQCGIVAAIYILYIFRLFLRTRNLDDLRLAQCKALVSADPAILLYPLLVPALVSKSLPRRSGLVETNLTLGLCSIPLKAIPFSTIYMQWLLTMIPLAYQKLHRGSEGGIDPTSDLGESAVYLYPLHLCLKSCIEYMTSTSLLATEVELLSAGLINLLIFADSPQMYILKGLLWLGALTLFCTCKDVLRWTVSLARVPSWKFRKISRTSTSAGPFWIALDEALGGWLSSGRRRKVKDDSEDSDEDSLVILRKPIATSGRRTRSGTSHAKRPTIQLPLQNGHAESPQRRATIDEHREHEPRSRQRRYTLPTAPSGLQDLPQLSQAATEGLKRFRQQPKYYPSLTSTQASLLKWIYAAFVYFMVVFTILGPLRIYVAYRALGGKEPVGWALGYLFGELPFFRYWTLRLKLDKWICLPLSDQPTAAVLRYLEGLLGITFGAANTRLLICAYCVACILFGLLLVSRLSAVSEVDTRRKVFHGMMVLMFGVAGFIDPSFVSLALSLVLAIFLLLDLFRAGQLPPVSRPLTIFLAPYVDGRDHKGPVVISPIFLLIGCAIPLWLSLAALDRTGRGAFVGWEITTRDVSMTTGVVCVGMGDAAASLIGRRFGRRRWPWGGGKSMEGSLAFAVAVIIGLMASRAYLAFGPWEWNNSDSWILALGKSAIAASAASLTETVLTGANDNVLVPVILWLWVRTLGI